MKKKRLLIAACVLALSVSGLTAGCKGKDEDSSKNEPNDSKNQDNKDANGWDLADQIIKTVKDNEPVFSDYKVSITDFGAEIRTEKLQDTDVDKTIEKELATKNTEAIKKAIADVSAHTEGTKKGGKVVIPAGYTYTGAIHLESNVNLYMEDNANVMFTTDYTQYPMVESRWEGVVCMNYSPMIYANGKENIAVTGKGILDGQATKEKYWLPWKNTKFLPKEDQAPDRKALFEMGENGVPVAERQFGPGHYLRPSFLQPYNCKNVLIEDIKIVNAPMWMVHPVFSENITIRGIELESFGYNNDGCNPDSCKNVVIEDCIFNTGDDCIAVKSGRNADGRSIAKSCENIVAQNNEFMKGVGATITVGSEMSGDVRNVFSLNNHSEATVEHLQSISIKTNGDRGGTIEKIYIKGLKAENAVDHAMLITKLYEEGDTGKTTPVIKDIFIDDCTFKGGNQDIVAILGYDRSPIENIQITNCTFDSPDAPATFFLANIKGLKLKDVTFNGKKYPDGEFVPSPENVEIVKESKSPSGFDIKFSCGALTSTLNPKWLVSDTEDGEYTDVANTESKEKVGNKIFDSYIRFVDASKYYKLSLTVNGKEWRSHSFKVGN